jgi:hypothetical protein
MHNTSKNVLGENDEIVGVKNLRATYESGTLIVSEVVTNDNQVETVTPVMVQPWKCLSDGSRAPFADETDAYNWLEEYKNQLF